MSGYTQEYIAELLADSIKLKEVEAENAEYNQIIDYLCRSGGMAAAITVLGLKWPARFTGKQVIIKAMRGEK